MINIKDFNDLVDFIQSHKIGHTFYVTRIFNGGGTSWSFYADNKKTQKRKVVCLRIEEDGSITGHTNILKGYDGTQNAWGSKFHGQQERLEFTDAGYLRFNHFFEKNFKCIGRDKSTEWSFAEFTYKPSN